MASRNRIPNAVYCFKYILLADTLHYKHSRATAKVNERPPFLAPYNSETPYDFDKI